MKRDRWLSGLLSAGVLSFTLATVGAQVAQAQRPINILDLKCLVTGGKVDNQGRLQNFGRDGRDISIARQLYTSIMSTREAGWTCKLPGGRASLRIEYGVSDQDQQSVSPPKIDVYVDGNQVASQVGKPGRINTMLVDVSNGKNLSIDISCSTAQNCMENPWASRPFQFFKFHFEPGASSPGRR
ncbi:hypothetical protein [Tychonema sp. BBK16]|uniref:hypothetical protein n=1 Tax=Tychonema sp. BBK16 TaxID=2699888 RepID=UPI001F3574FA|nr:hypothetical protein [Tychonema sp. BBK16]MCF6374928.1 hypothetical protein [Tychonema sp. BBK16]